MFLDTCIETGIGLTAGKLMCGKAVQKSDKAYLLKTKLKDLFLQLQKMLTVTERTMYSANHDRLIHMEQRLKSQEEELKKFQKRIEKAMILLELKGMSRKDIEKIVMTQTKGLIMTDHFISTLSEKMRKKEEEVLKIIVRDIVRRMERRKKKEPEDLEILKDFLGE